MISVLFVGGSSGRRAGNDGGGAGFEQILDRGEEAAKAAEAAARAALARKKKKKTTTKKKAAKKTTTKKKAAKKKAAPKKKPTKKKTKKTTKTTKKKTTKKKTKEELRKEIDAIVWPEELVTKIREDWEGDDEDIRLLPVTKWEDCEFGNYIVIPENTAGSDDYHESYLSATHNLKEVFGCDKFIATVRIYEKENPDEHAFVVVRHMQSWSGVDYPFEIVMF